MTELLNLTISFDFCALGVSLWLGFYLLGRGYPSRITLRAVIVFLALSGFFFGAFYNIFHQVPDSASLRAALLVIVLATWYSLTIQLLPRHLQTRQRPVSLGLYALASYTTCFLAHRLA
jgi:hypothetical protein